MDDSIKYKKLIEDTDKKLKKLMASWVLRYDYFGFLFSLILRRAVVGFPNPAAVCVTSSGRIELLYNPIILAGTSEEYLNEILHHEGLHILNKHLSRQMRILADIADNQVDAHRKLINIASDCCVNEQGNIRDPLIIASVPFALHFPKKNNLPPKKMMEEYYYILLERARKQDNNNSENKNQQGKENDDSNGNGEQNNQSNDNSDKKGDQEQSEAHPDKNNNNKTDQSGSGNGNPQDDDPQDGNGQATGGQGKDGSDLNNHHQWSNSEIVDPHSVSRNVDAYTQRIIRESAKNFQKSKARGKMPGYLQDLIELALKPVPIPYYEMIRQLVKGSRVGKYKRSSTHINRKRTYVFQLGGSVLPSISPFPGRKRDLSFNIGVLIDTSGSQTPDDILEALSGCKHLIEKDRHCKTTVLEVDTKIHKEYEVKKVSDIDFDVKGRAGTTLLPGIIRFKELNVDVCLCFTDGYTENFNKIDRKVFPRRMIWVITPGGSDEELNKVGFVVHLPQRNL